MVFGVDGVVVLFSFGWDDAFEVDIFLLQYLFYLWALFWEDAVIIE